MTDIFNHLNQYELLRLKESLLSIAIINPQILPINQNKIQRNQNITKWDKMYNELATLLCYMARFRQNIEEYHTKY